MTLPSTEVYSTTTVTVYSSNSSSVSDATSSEVGANPTSGSTSSADSALSSGIALSSTLSTTINDGTALAPSVFTSGNGPPSGAPTGSSSSLSSRDVLPSESSRSSESSTLLSGTPSTRSASISIDIPSVASSFASTTDNLQPSVSSPSPATSAGEGPSPDIQIGELLYIAVNTVTGKAKRALLYIAFDRTGISFLVDNKSSAAVFTVDEAGNLLSDGKYISTTTDEGTSALQKFTSPPVSPYFWFLDGSNLYFGAATFCVTSAEQFFVVYDDTPAEGCAAVNIAAEPGPAQSTSISIVQSTTPSVSPSVTSSGIASSIAASNTPSGVVIPSTESRASAVESTVASATSLSSRSSTSSISRSPSAAGSNPSGAISSSSLTNSISRSLSTPGSMPVDEISTSSSTRSISRSPTSSRSNLVSATPSSSSASFGSNIVGSTANPIYSLSSSTSTNAQTPSSSSQSSSVASSSTSPYIRPSLFSSDSSTTSAPTLRSAHTTTASTTISLGSLSLSASTTSRITTSTTSTPITCSARPLPTQSLYPAVPKRGLAYGNVSSLQFYSPPSQISWAYNYYSLPNNSATNNTGPFPSSQSPNMTFYPLLFNDNPSLTSIWEANVNFAVTHYGADAIFSFNEPDLCVQGSACMTVERALVAYERFIQPFAACGVKLAAPSVTNAGSGFIWLSQFLGNATQRNLTVDIINIHWYASPYNQQYFQDYMVNASRIGGDRPIWITEYGMDKIYPEPAVLQFVRNTTYWVDQQPWIQKTAWFGNYNNNLLNADGSGLSQRGRVWKEYVGSNYVYGFSKKRQVQDNKGVDRLVVEELSQPEDLATPENLASLKNLEMEDTFGRAWLDLLRGEEVGSEKQ
ncbi:uncharacterized protein HMPREF1541_03866 [Cyphellophora europaea CBS 101466]|uniref:Uncharacterized protein n=1 Tax=Cyphellophora europaea (strain CBS 101466) TaxID=1220924 RepID=W2RZT5_CYPE1|nr:uncharacterized protein HMPREF1541_03866 [Cyphellophora europaea CBS 101466]ETN41927.1 hypothetical protein HMPREF1541_03866 [Cyphellophora europaea CBS 101466]